MKVRPDLHVSSVDIVTIVILNYHQISKERLLMSTDRKQSQSVAIVHADINFHYIILVDANVVMLSIMLQWYQFHH